MLGNSVPDLNCPAVCALFLLLPYYMPQNSHHSQSQSQSRIAQVGGEPMIRAQVYIVVMFTLKAVLTSTPPPPAPPSAPAYPSVLVHPIKRHDLRSYEQKPYERHYLWKSSQQQQQYYHAETERNYYEHSTFMMGHKGFNQSADRSQGMPIKSIGIRLSILHSSVLWR